MSNMTSLNKRIVITTSAEGFHRWPEARDIEPIVGFLSDRHRHIFKFRVELEVNHGDRDIEFIKFKREFEEYLDAVFGTPCEFGRMSCEDIGEHTFHYFLNEGYSVHKIEVWEDGENGAIIEKQ